MKLYPVSLLNQCIVYGCFWQIIFHLLHIHICHLGKVSFSFLICMCFICFPLFKEPILICSTMLNRNGESRPPFLFLCSKKKLKVLMHLIKCRKIFNILQLILMLLFIVFIATLHEIQLDHTFLTGYSILCLKLP